MYKKINILILLLFLISLIVYFRWLNVSVFTFSDIFFVFSESLKYYSVPTLWISSPGFGAVDTLIWRLPFYEILGFIGNLGYGSNVAEKIVYFWPVALLSGLSSFLLIKKIVKNDIGALIGSIIFAYNTYFLSINSQGHQLLTVAFIFSTFTLLFLIKFLEEKEIYFGLLTTLMLFGVGVYDLRSLYIILGLMILYLLYYFVFIEKIKKKDFLKGIFYYSIPFILFIPLSFYWLLPTFFSKSFSESGQLGRLVSYSEFYNLAHAVSLHFPFWTGGVPQWDRFISVPWYFWLYPVFAVLGLLVNRKNIQVLFYGLVAAMGILLTKQVDIPFDNLYIWLYSHFPGFNAFREASKFYFLIALGYSVLIGSFCAYIWGKWNSNIVKNVGKYIVITGIVLLPLWNTKPLLTGEIGTLFIPKTIPRDIITTKNFIFNQEEYFRTAWIHYSARWNLVTNNHPAIDTGLVIGNEWKKYLPYQYSHEKKEGSVILQNMQENTMDKLLDFNSVKYVMVLLDDKETKDYIEQTMRIPKKQILSELKKIHYLKQLDIGTKEILVYENAGYRPHIYITTDKEKLSKSVPYQNVRFQTINPSEHTIRLNNVRKPVYLQFTDTFHPQWAIRIGQFNWLESLRYSSYFLTDNYHFANSMNFNSYLIDPAVICKNNNNCKKNMDGSYDIYMTLFFKPQSYLYLGIIISGITLVGILLGLFYIIIRKLNRNGKNK